MVKIEINERKVTFMFEGSQKFLALKKSLSIPIKKIESVSTEDVNPPWLAGRIGTHLPPLFWAGTFWTRKGKIFYYVRDKSKCITINLQNHDYSKVVIEVDDKHGVSKEIKQIHSREPSETI